MKKDGYFTKFMRFLVVVVFAVVVSACSLQKDSNIIAIRVDEETIPEYVFVGKFDDARIRAKIDYEDGEYEWIDITTEFLSEESRKKLDIVGEHKIEILFKDTTTHINIKVVEDNQFHQVKFFNGFNELISLQLVKNGDDAQEPNLESHLLQGYEFVGWDRAFTNIQEDINVYAIYSKHTVAPIEEDLTELYSTVVQATITSPYLNTLDISENSSKRIITTIFTEELGTKGLIRKYVSDDGSLSYEKFWINNFGSTDSYFLKEEYTAQGYTSLEIGVEYFNSELQKDYVVSSVLKSADSLNFEIFYSSSKPLYKLVATYLMENSEEVDTMYEILFNDEQIILVKEFANNQETGTLEQNYTKYYFINPAEEERVVFPEVEE